MSYGVEKNANLANMRLAYSVDGTAVYKPLMPTTTTTTTTTDKTHNFQQQQHQSSVVSVSGGGLSMNMNSNSGEPMKRKRGRPRKYAPDADGVTMALHLLASPPPPPQQQQQQQQPQQQQQQQQPPPPVPVSVQPTSTASVATKKGRGRPPGSGRKQHPSSSALGSVGVGFTPHVISVKAGEDVLAKIMSFSQNGPRTVCILSANGAISNVTLRQAATSGGTVTYEGRFEILSLSGSFLLSEIGGQRSRTGGLSVSLAGPDGRVLGGGVAGLLTAASPVQVIVGSFIAEGGRKESKSGNQSEPLSAPAKLVPGASKAGSPPSRGTLSESSGGPASPLNQSAGGCNNSNPQGLANMPWK